MKVISKTVFFLFSFTSWILFSSCESPTPTIKRTIKINPINTEYIELEDGTRYGMGQNLYDRLVSELKKSKQFILIIDEKAVESALFSSNSLKSSQEKISNPSDRLHFRFPPLASASFSASMQGLTYRKGSKGTSHFSGFNRSYRTPWNSGKLDSINEFPPRNLEFQRSWFGSNFSPIGSKEDNSITGVDVGEAGELNLIILSIRYKRERFLASSQINTKLQLLEENTKEEQVLEAHGSGFIFAAGLSFAALELDLRIAKKTALKETFDHSIKLMTDFILKKLKNTPFRSRVEFNNSEGIIIHAGRREGVKVGDIFRHMSNGKESTLEVVEAFYTGSIVKVISGNSQILSKDIIVFDNGSSENAAMKNKMKEMSFLKRSIAKRTLKKKKAISKNLIPENRSINFKENRIASSAKKEAKKIYFDPPEFSHPNENAQKALDYKKNLSPYLISRWKQYDQEVKIKNNIPPPHSILEKAKQQENLAQISLMTAWERYFTHRRKGTVVAIIDSGVDYNHNNLYEAFNRKYVGWDFFSYDARPFDDNSHGTAIAGIIAARGIENEPVGIAPQTRLLSYRIFNPYGETNSASIYKAFQKAIQDGVRIIVAAWDTAKHSEGLKEAMILAKKNNVLVITSAGYQGKDLQEEQRFPASYGDWQNVITVAALDEKGKLLKQPGKHSNYGPTVVSIGAPEFSSSLLSPRNRYWKGETSHGIAAAHVAGIASLLFSLRPNASAADLKKAILNGAKEDASLAHKISRGRKLYAPGAMAYFSALVSE